MSTIKRTFTLDFPNRPAPEGSAVEYVVSGLYVWSTDGEPSEVEVAAFLAPEVAPAHLNNGGLVRFTGTVPATVLEAIRMAGVTRVAKGRWRVSHETAMPSDQYSVTPSVFDANPRIIRVTARTANYVEVRVTDLAGAAQDATEVTVKTERVIL
ncbi:MAG: hypothetical protein JWM16_6362 [Verrucomicrobiales bacterium]|nr:hypothetical protein [Verrucomicrobiales bacterium]